MDTSRISRGGQVASPQAVLAGDDVGLVDLDCCRVSFSDKGLRDLR
jgi:hypothetical protein